MVHIAGFLIQILPCMLLCLLPFSKDKFKINRNKLIGILTLICIIFSIIFALTIYYISFNDNYNRSIISNAFMGVAIIACCTLFFVCIKESVYKKLMVICVILIYAAFIYIGVNLMKYTLFIREQWPGQGYTYSYYTLTYFLILSAITLPIIWKVMIGPIRKYLENIDSRFLRRTFYIILVLTILYYIFLASIFPSMADVPSKEEKGLFLFFVYTYFFASLCLIIAFWFLFWEILKIQEKSKYRSLLRIQQIRYQEITENIANVQRTNHDMRHHFRVIDNLITEEKHDKAREYINECVTIIESGEIEQFCIEPMVNALLQYYVGEARKKDIKCDIRVSMEHCPIDNIDMTVLLGNCLENAITSCDDIKDDIKTEKFIRLNIKTINSTLAILMENSCNKVLFTGYDQSYTDNFVKASEFKSIKKEGGIGLTSIEHTVKKYAGIAEYKYTPPIFYTRITLELNNIR